MKLYNYKILTAAIVLVLAGFSTVGASCITSCQHQLPSGVTCNVGFTQGSDSFTFSVNCSDGYSDIWNGSGQFGGTICGGIQPCAQFQEN